MKTPQKIERKNKKLRQYQNIQLLNNENASEFKNESKINSIFLINHLKADSINVFINTNSQI